MSLTATLIALLSAVGPVGDVQTAADARALAEYRLTERVFRQFERASGLIAKATRDDPRFVEAPLFTREVAVTGDASAAAAALEARLLSEPILYLALDAAKMTAREYATFALALLAARLAHGFVAAGVLQDVPAGVAADNVRFVDTHQAEITAVLKTIGVVSPE
jgi:hypothetical protein